MKKIAFVRVLLFSLYVIYNAQGTIYAQGGKIATFAIVFIFLISGTYLMKTLFDGRYKPLFYRAWTGLLFLNIIGFVLTADFNMPSHMNMMKGILTTSLSFYPFYYMSQRGNLKSIHLFRFFVVMCAITILQFYFNRNQILAERLSSDGNIVNNVAYSFVRLMPFVFLIKKNNVYAFSVMALLFLFVIQGGKRGALIIGVIVLILFVYYQLKTIEVRHRMKSSIIIIIAAILLGYYGYNYFQKNEYFILRMQSLFDGNSSGRDVIYKNLFNSWYYSQNIAHLIFGYGFASSIFLSGNGLFAHNDWLELLTNFGLFGVVIYVLLFLGAFVYIKNKTWCVDKRVLLMTVFTIWLLSSFFSMSYTSMNSYLLSIMFAYLIGSKSVSVE